MFNKKAEGSRAFTVNNVQFKKPQIALIELKS